MIKHSIVKWIVENALVGNDTVSDYTLRYSLALLMNISLRAIGTYAILFAKEPPNYIIVA